MKIQKTIPPAAAPVYWKDLLRGLSCAFNGQRLLARLESEIQEYFGVRHVFLVTSGKEALTLILMGLKDISPRKEVIIPAYTCYSVPSAVLKAGLQLSLCDIETTTFDFDYPSLERMVNKNTLCVVPCHLFGIASDMDLIESICREREIFVVEDAAQAMGGTFKNQRLGTIGDVGLFSLGRGKNLTSGSGGIIVTNSDPIAEAIRQHYSKLNYPGRWETLAEWLRLSLMAVFIAPALYWLPTGLPFLKLGETFFYKDFPMRKLAGMQAAVLHDWKKKLDQFNNNRTSNGAYFEEQFGLSRSSGREASIPYLRFPFLASSRQERDRIYALSKQRGFGISLMYPKAINQIEELKAEFKGKEFPAAEKVADRLLALPTHPYVSTKDREALGTLFVGLDHFELSSEQESSLRQTCR